MQLTEKQQRVIEYLNENKLATVNDVARVIHGETHEARNVIDQLHRKHIIKKSYRKELMSTFGGAKIGRRKFVVCSLVN